MPGFYTFISTRVDASLNLEPSVITASTDTVWGPFICDSSESSLNSVQYAGHRTYTHRCFSFKNHSLSSRGFTADNSKTNPSLTAVTFRFSAPESRFCKYGTWFGFALVWIRPFLLPFVFLDARTFLLSSPLSSINDWRTRAFSCQPGETFGTELSVSARALTASRCFQRRRGTRIASNWKTRVIQSQSVLPGRKQNCKSAGKIMHPNHLFNYKYHKYNNV